MIRLIASDMDGTMLDGDSKLPPDLHSEGIGFVAASGRRIDTLMELFSPIIGIVDFVASNGAQVASNGFLLDNEIFSRAALHRLSQVVARFDCLHLAVFDRKCSYLLDPRECYVAEFDKDLPEPVLIGRPSPAVNIIKASINCEGPIMDMAYALTREMGDDFVFAPSGERWIDVMQRGVNKATGLDQILSLRGVDASEVIAFGDSMNDYELLRMVGESCAMENGRSALKEICTRVIGSNEEHAVQAELSVLLERARADRGSLRSVG